MSLYSNGPGTANDWHFIYAACDYLCGLFPKKAATDGKDSHRSEDATATETTVSLQDLLPSDVEEFDNRAYVSSLVTSMLSHKFETPAAAAIKVVQHRLPPAIVPRVSAPSAGHKTRTNDATNTASRPRPLQLGLQKPAAGVPHRPPPPAAAALNKPAPPPSKAAAGKKKQVGNATNSNAHSHLLQSNLGTPAVATTPIPHNPPPPVIAGDSAPQPSTTAAGKRKRAGNATNSNTHSHLLQPNVGTSTAATTHMPHQPPPPVIPVDSAPQPSTTAAGKRKRAGNVTNSDAHSHFLQPNVGTPTAVTTHMPHQPPPPIIPIDSAPQPSTTAAGKRQRVGNAANSNARSHLLQPSIGTSTAATTHMSHQPPPPIIPVDSAPQPSTTAAGKGKRTGNVTNSNTHSHFLQSNLGTPVATTTGVPRTPPPPAVPGGSAPQPSTTGKRKRTGNATNSNTHSHFVQPSFGTPAAATIDIQRNPPPPVIPGDPAPQFSTAAAGKRKRVDDTTAARQPLKRAKTDGVTAVNRTLPLVPAATPLMSSKQTNEDGDGHSQKKVSQRPRTVAPMEQLRAGGPGLDRSMLPFQVPSLTPDWFFAPPMNDPTSYEAPLTSHDTYPIFTDTAGTPYSTPPTASDATRDADDGFYDSGEPFYGDLHLFDGLDGASGAAGRLQYDVETLSPEEAAWLDQLAIAFDARGPSGRPQAIPNTPQLDALLNSQEAWLLHSPFTPGVQVPSGRAQVVPNTVQLDALLASGDSWLVQPPFTPGVQVPVGRAQTTPNTQRLGALLDGRGAWPAQPPITPGVQVPTGRAQTIPNTPRLEALLDNGGAWLAQPPFTLGAPVPNGLAHAIPSTPQLVYGMPQNPYSAQHFGNSAVPLVAAQPPAAIPQPQPQPQPRPRQTLYTSTLKAAALAQLLRSGNT